MARVIWRSNSIDVVHIPTIEAQVRLDKVGEPMQLPVLCGMTEVWAGRTIDRGDARQLFLEGALPKYMYEGLSHCLACCYALRREAGIEIGRAG